MLVRRQDCISIVILMALSVLSLGCGGKFGNVALSNPAAPLVLADMAMTVENVRYNYFHGPTTGFYSTDSTLAGVNPVLTITSTDTRGQKTVYFEKVLVKIGGYWQMAGNSSVKLMIPGEQAAKILDAQAKGVSLVMSVEDRGRVDGAGKYQILSASTQLNRSPGAGPKLGAVAAEASLPGFQLLTKTSIYYGGSTRCPASPPNTVSLDVTEPPCNDMAVDPLVIDFSGAGFQTTEPNTVFDLLATGSKDVISWLAPNTNQGFLVLDLNGNGQVDNGSELFGNISGLRPDALMANGFESIKLLDSAAFGGNGDGILDAKDAYFSALQVWFDRNSNGQVDAGELASLVSTGVRSIDLKYTVVNQIDTHGNKILGRGLASTGSGQKLNVADIWFHAK